MADYSVFWRDPDNPPMKLVRGEGVYLFDDGGNRYIDAAAGAAVCSLGYGNEEVAETLKEQAKKLNYTHTSEFGSEPLIKFADELVSLSPDGLTKVHPVSGGSEATETALKLARVFNIERGQARKYKVISRSASYHGATLGVLPLTGKTSRQEAFAPMMVSATKISPAYCYRCPFGRSPDNCSLECANDLERAIVEEGEETVSAFIAEPISGASLPGVHPPDEYWVRVREICDKYDVLLIVDEVMSGAGRSGRWWAIDHSGVVPDMIASSKGLGAGYTPLGAVVIHDRIYQELKGSGDSFNHGFTYEGNPVSAAAGLKILQIMQREDLIEKAGSTGEKLLDSLRDSIGDRQNVGEIRGRGLLIGVEFVRDEKSREPFPKGLNIESRIRKACLKNGLHVYPGGSPVNGRWNSHVLIAPPFTLDDEHVEKIVTSLKQSIEEVISGL